MLLSVQRPINSKDWSDVIYMVEQQSLLGISFDGIERMPKDQLPDMDILMNWLGQVSYMETVYDQHQESITKLAKFYKTTESKWCSSKGIVSH